MEENKQANPSFARRHRFLQRGESMVASTGLVVAAILLAAMGTSAWWAAQTNQHAKVRGQEAEILAAGDLLASTTESLLESGELTAARRIIADAARRYGFESCRVLLPDGRVVADTVPAQINTLNLPDSWAGDAVAMTSRHDEATTRLEASYPLSVPGRGALTLEVTAVMSQTSEGIWELQAEAGLVGSAALLALLGVYRRMRRRLVTLGAIREALLAYERGVTNESALLLNGEHGDVAQAWNLLLQRKEETNRKLLVEKAEQTLGAQSTGRGGDLQSACDAMRQGLILVDEQLRTRYINGAAAVLLQTSRERCQDQDVRDFIQQTDVLSMLDAAVAGGARRWRSVEVERGEDGQSGVLRFSARPVRREDSASAMILIEDLTQQRVAEEARKSFVTQATHELRTPLTNIRLYVETALEEGEQDVAVRAKCLNTINDESRRLERIVGDMLSVSAIEAGSIRLVKDDVRLDVVFARLQADYEAMAGEKNITLRFDLPPKLPVMQGDRDKIVLAMHNLLGNALKYTREGGAVRVRVDIEDTMLLFEISDTGIGVDPAESEMIFEKFYRATNSNEGSATGSGLGLALARDMIRMHGGDITVESELQRGSKFSLTLPILSEAA